MFYLYQLMSFFSLLLFSLIPPSHWGGGVEQERSCWVSSFADQGQPSTCHKYMLWLCGPWCLFFDIWKFCCTIYTVYNIVNLKQFFVKQFSIYILIYSFSSVTLLVSLLLSCLSQFQVQQMKLDQRLNDFVWISELHQLHWWLSLEGRWFAVEKEAFE